MPSFNDKRQPQGTRLQRRLPSADRRSTSRQDGGLRYRNGPANPFSSRGLRVRWLAGRGDDDDGEDGGHGGHHDLHKFADGPGDGGKSVDDDPGESSGDDISDNDISSDDGLSDDDSDAEDDNNVPQQTTIQSTIISSSSSGSIVTLTAVPPSQVTTSLSDVLTTLTPLIATPSPVVVNPVKLPTDLTSTSSPTVTPRPSGRKEEGSTSSISLAITAAIPTTPTTTSVELASETASETTSSMIGNGFNMGDNNGSDNDNGNDGGKHKIHDDKGNTNNPNNRGGLNPTAEHLLIAAGAIGAFILLCSVGWIVYRVLKRSKGGDSGMGFLDKLSWRRRAPMEGASAWDARTLYVANEVPPIYEKDEYGTTMSGNFYGPGKAYPPGPGSLARSNSGTSALRQQPNDNLAPASIIDLYERDNDALSLNNNINLTMRTQMSQMSQPYYKESEMPRRPPPENRASQLSSLSSGFGDGDIIIPPPLAVKHRLPEPDSDNPAADDTAREDPAARDSWVNRDDDRRETVYTTTSEDRPARFRSITSWVNQQAGRAKRAGSRARERGEVPVIPAIPGEINMTRQTAYR
ncbi:hypothetical protein GGR53DRAFT_232431 [Hypoxylon sp. FL1150]|nr:hypothetical protein GGR53DRAFT_232431 [Hypoxylon sp. FL1150]